MKAKQSIFGLLLFLLGMISSCVNDDSFFPDESEGELISSVSLVSYVDYLKNEQLSEERLCFNFIYPISLGLNANDGRVRIDNYEALLNAISSQSLNFNIQSIAFPFQIQFIGSDQPVIISTEQDFINALGDCQISLFREDFSRYFNECFKLDYPVTLLSEENNEVVINSDTEWFQFLESQSARYQPVFKFPVNIIQLANEQGISVDSYFGFYRIFQECQDACPSLFFSFDNTNPADLGYRFVTEYSVGFTGTYSWFVNDQFIEDDGPAVQGDDVLEYNFDTPGTYLVCIKTETQDCPQGTSYCKEIVVESFCPALFYEFDLEPGSTNYTFTAAFDGIQEVTYDWTIDGELIETDGGVEGDNILVQDLAPGSYSVCLKAITRTCPEGVEFCREIVVASVCPDLFFVAEQEGDTPSYNFFADFAGMNEITYSWTINGDVIEQDGGGNGDNTLFYQFSPGTYNVCIIAETPDCPEGTDFCLEIVVN